MFAINKLFLNKTIYVFKKVRCDYVMCFSDTLSISLFCSEQVFDGFIVVASFIVDLVFIKGLSAYKIQKFVVILAFLVPWRVIRVVNSK